MQGQGFIAVQGPNGQEAYTRNGDLHVTPEGLLVTSTGQAVLGDDGPISVPPSASIKIARRRHRLGPAARAARATRSPPSAASSWSIRTRQSLVRESGGLFQLANGGTAPADASVKLASGVLESSNVDLASAMVNMIDLARNFELQVKAMKSAGRQRPGLFAAPASHLNRSTRHMNAALWAAKTGLDAQQTEMAVISNNLANVNTTGFKQDRAVFEDLLYQNQTQAGADTSQTTQSPSGMSIGTGVQVVATEKDYSQGSLTQTGNPLDVAIQGQGFFQIQMPDGTLAYTRDGTFQTNAQGQLVTSSGYLVQPGITIPQGAQSVTIGSDGTVSVTLAGQSAPTQIGQLQLANFINPPGLQPIGQNLLVQSAASGSPQTGSPGVNGFGTLAQGELESSNVNVVEELVNMIQTQRAYEMNSKAISTVDQMLQYATQNT